MSHRNTSISLRSTDSARAKGSLALIGGRFEADNDALYSALRDRCDGRIAVLSMASGYPTEVGDETVEEFRAQGFYAELVPIFFETRQTSPFDNHLIERLKAFGSVFFTGGDQSRIVGTLVQNDAETPALQALRDLYQHGGLIAGSSAGAAIMSGPMILGGTSLNALARGVVSDDGEECDYDDFRLGEGLGFFDRGMVDQHFLARGRIGRLICAALESGESLAFGVDENSALIVHGDEAEVFGETGVVMIDLRRMDRDPSTRSITNLRISYLDHGDSVDLKRGLPRPARDKKRARVSRLSYRSPAPVRRNAFASYGIYDLILRLVEGDPAHYRRDSAEAFDPLTGTQVTLNLERLPRKSRALQGRRQGDIRYSAFDFKLDIYRVSQNVCPLPQSNRVLRPNPTGAARLVLLGNSPMYWDRESQQSLRPHLVEPVGILPTASGEPREMAERYVTWLEREGIECQVLPISLNNIERASRDRALLKSIDRMGSLLLTGGDQRRLTDALLHCAEATPVLHSLVTAFERGTPVIAVAGAASAFAQRMIAEGDSVDAFRHGSSEDASGSGVIVEQGIGLIDDSLVDQHFLRRRRLGRLLVACAQQGLRFGFGLCEGSGLILHGNGDQIEAIGSPGVVVVDMDNSSTRLTEDQIDPAGIRLYPLANQARASLSDLPTSNPVFSAPSNALDQCIEDLLEDHRNATGRYPEDRSAWRSLWATAIQ